MGEDALTSRPGTRLYPRSLDRRPVRANLQPQGGSGGGADQLDEVEVTQDSVSSCPLALAFDGTDRAAGTTFLLVMSKTRDQLYEQLLVLRSQRGDAQALDELVGRFQHRLWHHAYQLLGEEEAAWETLQEGWLAIIKGLPSVRDPAAFPRWTYRIVTNKAADWLRKRRREELVFTEVADDATPPMALVKGDDPVKAALQLLPASSRAMLSLRYGGDLSISEIATILGVPEGTVKSRLHRVCEALRALLEANGYD